ncbi:hypothetical protein SFRURICE_001262 [Spodoptera frugiperda]|nr:hypothetical protein SFRURICE_001262 [Spodoptera frugiperda]
MNCIRKEWQFWIWNRNIGKKKYSKPCLKYTKTSLNYIPGANVCVTIVTIVVPPFCFVAGSQYWSQYTGKMKMEKIVRHKPWTTSGQSQKQIKPWKYMSHMEFLLPCMTNAERDTNVTHPDISCFEETTNTDVSRDSADTITAPKKSKKDEIIHNDEDLRLQISRKEPRDDSAAAALPEEICNIFVDNFTPTP